MVTFLSLPTVCPLSMLLHIAFPAILKPIIWRSSSMFIMSPPLNEGDILFALSICPSFLLSHLFPLNHWRTLGCRNFILGMQVGHDPYSFWCLKVKVMVTLWGKKWFSLKNALAKELNTSYAGWPCPGADPYCFKVYA